MGDPQHQVDAPGHQPERSGFESERHGEQGQQPQRQDEKGNDRHRGQVGGQAIHRQPVEMEQGERSGRRTGDQARGADADKRADRPGQAWRLRS